MQKTDKNKENQNQTQNQTEIKVFWGPINIFPENGISYNNGFQKDIKFTEVTKIRKGNKKK